MSCADSGFFCAELQEDTEEEGGSASEVAGESATAVLCGAQQASPARQPDQWLQHSTSTCKGSRQEATSAHGTGTCTHGHKLMQNGCPQLQSFQLPHAQTDQTELVMCSLICPAVALVEMHVLTCTLLWGT